MGAPTTRADGSARPPRRAARPDRCRPPSRQTDDEPGVRERGCHGEVIEHGVDDEGAREACPTTARHPEYRRCRCRVAGAVPDEDMVRPKEVGVGGGVVVLKLREKALARGGPQLRLPREPRLRSAHDASSTHSPPPRREDPEREARVERGAVVVIGGRAVEARRAGGVEQVKRRGARRGRERAQERAVPAPRSTIILKLLDLTRICSSGGTDRREDVLQALWDGAGSVSVGAAATLVDRARGARRTDGRHDVGVFRGDAAAGARVRGLLDEVPQKLADGASMPPSAARLEASYAADSHDDMYVNFLEFFMDLKIEYDVSEEDEMLRPTVHACTDADDFETQEKLVPLYFTAMSMLEDSDPTSSLRSGVWWSTSSRAASGSATRVSTDEKHVKGG